MRRTAFLSSCVVIAILLMTGWAYATTFTVDSLVDLDDGLPYTPFDGTNTLRKCIRLANNNSGGDIIDFAVSGVIFPGSPLPEIVDDGTIIDASSRWMGPWPDGQPGIILDGVGAGANEEGLKIFGAGDCQIRGLFITNFGGKGVLIFGGAQLNTIGGAGVGERNVISGNGEHGVEIRESSTGNTVSGNYIGTDVSGTLVLGNAGHGINISGEAQANVVGGTTDGKRNIISGNGWDGVAIWNSGTDNNVVSGNFVGTDLTGTVVLGNAVDGIEIRDSANNTIGGTMAGARNIISGNGVRGVIIQGDSSATGNLVLGNFIGTDLTGTIDLGNSQDGVVIRGTPGNTIGGTQPGARNVISGNDHGGVLIKNIPDIGVINAAENLVQGNFIGTDVTGTIDLGNNGDGVLIERAFDNTIGGTEDGSGNLISGNVRGVRIWGSDAAGNLIQGNFIGTDATGTADLGNAGHGIAIVNGAQSNIIGGMTAGERNIISGNDANGVGIADPGTSSNVVVGNYIGTDVTGTAPLGNRRNGVDIWEAEANRIGGLTEGERNVISGNHNEGVAIGGSSSKANRVGANYIGTDASGTAPLGNGWQGVVIHSGAKNNTIGGVAPEARNIISANGINGVLIDSDGTDDNRVTGNYIGTDFTGTMALGNSSNGVAIAEQAKSNTIGGTIAGARNIISGNDGHGIAIRHSGTANNVASGNYIGTDATGTVDLGNGGNGVLIGDGAQWNTIGGVTAGEGNIVSGNDWDGVAIVDPGTDNNVVSGNFIGTDVTGTVDLGNSGVGVVINGEAKFNTIGGTTEGERNIISGNDGWNAVFIIGSDNNKISGNYIGTDVTGTLGLGNSGQGVEIRSGAQSNIIGGTTEGERNIISGNNGAGVTIWEKETNNNIVSGNYIGTDVTGAVALGNSGGGVAIHSGAQSNVIGGASPVERNIISGNVDNGVYMDGPGTDSNVVSGNFIGTDVTGTADLGNSFNGVTISNGAQSNTIGGTTPGERNIISGNIHGIGIWNSGTNNNVVSGNYIGTDVTGTAKLGNSGNGVAITGKAQSNTVGGATAGERNIISGNGSHGVIILDPDTENNRVLGNYIGTDVGGTAALGNTASGVRIDSGAKSNTIGGATPGERNIISGNDGGVIIDHSGTNGNRVSGNYIGTDVNGTAALGNIWAGVGIYDGAQSNTIGGTTDGERNVISGNNASGVLITGSGTNSNIVSGNYIGTDATGTADLGNSRSGVVIFEGAQSNTIGGTGVGAGNTIAFNDQRGVVVRDDSTDFNRISRNSMHDNAGLGIDLVDDGNDEIPAPTITSGDLLGNILTVSGTGAGAGATVEVFKADSFASGEGMTYLGSLTADGSGDFSGPLDVTGKGISAGDPLVATTTHTNNNTSEFSAPIAVTVSYVLIPATIDLDPGTLNIKSKGKWISCYIELSEDYEEYSVEQIDTTSVKLWVEENHIPAEEKPITVGDHDKDGIPDLMVKFDRAALIEYLSAADDVSEDATSEYVTLTVNGQVGDDAIFEGTDTLRITGSDKATTAQEELAAPAKTSEFALYQNFPNSFNPDTWIPYGLAEDVEVTITIYSVSGKLIRILDLGHKPAGFYTTRSKAAYWDGRNEAGEQVSSGIYFCNIKAGEYTATRKMIARK